MSDPLSYPSISAENKVWTRWWWLGSAVDKENLTRLLTQYRDAGIGGVEICPIYGARGAESRYLQYLSPQWMEMLVHTTAEAKRLGMGVDFTTGTGWPFGGPQVSDADASMTVMFKKIEVIDGKSLKEPLPKGKLEYAIAISERGERVDVTRDFPQFNLPAGSWSVYCVLTTQPIQKVKRAAPGAEGNVVDPYSLAALDAYLRTFGDAFAATKFDSPRAHFHDSFEYFKANWTPELFDEFQKRRGYDLRTQLPALMGEGDQDIVARVKCDYRETIHDLHLAYIERWSDWAHAHKSLSRNQAHGAPGNLLDIYFAADIPETEIFGDVPESEFTRIQFATSAAHLKGTTLASAEAFTWLGEHFQVSLNDLKKPADFLFLCGINHLFFHGIPYSPDDAGWPGWLFYASVHFGPNGGLWHDLPAFNAYVARCQSILQSGKPDNDLLLYYPQYDLWQRPSDLMEQCGVHNQKEWLFDTSFFRTSELLRSKGYSFDVISDRWLQKATIANNSKVAVGEQHYAAVVVPQTKVMSIETMQKLVSLAKSGAKVIVIGSLPSDVPGMERKLNPLDRFTFTGEGKLKVVDEQALLESLGSIRREPMVDHGLQCLRRSNDEGYTYFIVNKGDRSIDGWVELGVPAMSVVAMDPLQENRIGLCAVKSDASAKVYLQLRPHESIILRTFTSKKITGPAWRYEKPVGSAVEITGNWWVEFIEGGPVLPKSFQTPKLVSWTDLDDVERKRFCGTARYRLRFNKPAGNAKNWQLDLGRIADSARVQLNGKDLGILWCAPFAVSTQEALREGENELIVEVSNVAANRIGDADRRGVNWKAFHEINFVNRDYKPFDASNWPARPAGLLGPVTLEPMQSFQP